jgi:hypothetical protein
MDDFGKRVDTLNKDLPESVNMFRLRMHFVQVEVGSAKKGVERRGQVQEWVVFVTKVDYRRVLELASKVILCS